MKLVATVREHVKRVTTFEGKETDRHVLVLLDNDPAGDCLNQFPEFELDREQAKVYPDGSLVNKTVNISVSKILSIFQGAPRITGRMVIVTK